MKKGLATAIIGVLLVIGLLGSFSVINNQNSYEEFVASGFIIDPSTKEAITDDAYNIINFKQGDKYKEKYTTKISFSDINGNKKEVSTDHFIHYDGGSLGAFTKGALVNIEDLEKENISYYSIPKSTILVKQGSTYEISSKGETVKIDEFLWKLSDTEYMLGSPTIVLNIAGEDVTFEDYVQITYVDNGVVRLSHMNGTYQTISEDSKLVTASGAELSLVGKGFFNEEGDAILALDDMAINDNKYIVADETAPDYELPTFVAIDGENGAEAEIGEDGEEGDEGNNGSGGESGGSGDAGSKGSSGADGVEGDQGQEGLNGLGGEDGKDAEQKDTGDVAHADVTVRPVITLESVNSDTNTNAYRITSTSIDVTMKLSDPDNALIREDGATKVILYNKDTMEQITNDDMAKQEGAKLANAGSLTTSFSNLHPGTNYLLVVNGQYRALDGVVYDVVLFDKSFTTDTLGVSLLKYEVGEDYVMVAANVIDTSIESYDVEFYWIDGGEEKTWASYANNEASTEQKVFTLSTTEPSTANGRKAEFDGVAVSSNREYYARISNVKAANGQLINSGDTVVSLKTLKKKPYNKAKYKADNTVEYITNMAPTLTANERNKSLTISLPDGLMDDNLGIKSYKYELYKEIDYNQAIEAGKTIAECTPAYTKTLESLSNMTFTLADGDNQKYIARIVVEFDNNESVQEYATLISPAACITSESNSLLVQFVSLQKTYSGEEGTSGKPDLLDGTLKITDPNGCVGRYVSDTNPIKIVVSSEHEDVQTVLIKRVEKREDNNYYATFRVDGLYPDASYSVIAYGPYDYKSTSTSEMRTLSSPELNTYLTGSTAHTTQMTAVSLVATQNDKTSSAFAYNVAFTKPDKADYYDFYTKYELQIMEQVNFELVHVREDGTRKIMGTAQKDDTNDLHQNSDFETNYLSRTQVADKTETVNGTDIKYLSTAETLEVGNSFVITADDFKIDPNDAELFMGGYFVISATSGKTYKGYDIPFNSADDENTIKFTVSKQHLVALDPNRDVDTSVITNEEAANGYKQSDLKDNTQVGIRFQSNYAYDDIDQKDDNYATSIIYSVYKVESDKATDVIDQSKVANADAMLYYDLSDPDNTNRTQMEGVTYNDGITLTKMMSIETKYTGNIELYFSGTHVISSVDGEPIECIIRNGTNNKMDLADRKSYLSRGNRYIITYKVKTNGSTKCNANSQEKDVYPNCKYPDEMIPLYRSAVIETVKQTPTIQRYLYNTNTDTTNSKQISIEYMYHLNDPDNAIIFEKVNPNDNNEDASCVKVIKYNKIEDYSSQNKLQSYLVDFGKSADYYKDENGFIFKNFVINNDSIKKVENGSTKMQLGKYYTVVFKYKVSDVSDVVSKESAPELLIPNMSSGLEKNATNDEKEKAISVRGLKDSNGDAAVGVVNDSGYRYRITIVGKPDVIYNYVALKVKVTGLNGSSAISGLKPVIYDPVKISTVNTAKEGSENVAYAVAYIDTGAIAGLKEKGATNIQFEIQGYYRTGVSGYQGFSTERENTHYKEKWDCSLTNATTKANNEEIEEENVYLIKYYNGTTVNNSYSISIGNSLTNMNVRYRTKNFVDDFLPYGSIFLPGEGSGDKGLTITFDEKGDASAKFQARYFDDAIITKGDPVIIDREGGKSATISDSGVYIDTEEKLYNVEKLAVSDVMLTNLDTNSGIEIGNLLPAVENNGYYAKSGATSATHAVNVLGVHADNIKIYARIYRKEDGGASKLLKIEKETGSEDGRTVDIFNVGDEASGDESKLYDEDYSGDYSYANMNDSNIQIDTVSGNQLARFRLRGLTKDTTYQIVYYTYTEVLDANGAGTGKYVINDLYSIDGNTSSYKYELTTLSEIKILTGETNFFYNTYTDKGIEIQYAISDAEGSGMLLKYRLLKDDVEVPNSRGIAQRLSTKLNGADYYYYSSSVTTNIPIKIDMNPGNGVLELNGTYKLEITAIDEGDENAPSPTILGKKELLFNTPTTLNKPSFFVTTSQKTVTVNGESRDIASVRVLANNAKRTIKGDTYKVMLMKDGNALQTEVIALEASQSFKAVDFRNVKLEVGTKYIIRVQAEIDTNNDGNADVVNQDTVFTSKDSPSAILGCNANQSTINITLSNKQYFDQVGIILFTVYDSQGNEVFTGSKSLTPAEAVEEQTIITCDWSEKGVTAGGSYYLQLQYQNASGVPLDATQIQFKVNE